MGEDAAAWGKDTDWEEGQALETTNLNGDQGEASL